MSYLIDTCILLRFLLRHDANFPEIRRAVRLIKSKREKMYLTPQIVAEFWNVCTRPVTARGGLGLSGAEAKNRLELLERNFSLLPDSPKIYEEWKRLISTHQVSGVQVHDARLVATMNIYKVSNLITLNVKDFSRYQNISINTPQSIR